MSYPASPFASDRSGRGISSSVAAFAIGIPLAAGILAVFHYGPLQNSPAKRYVSHPVECVEVVLFCCAISALGMKLWRCVTERAVFHADSLPAWDGRPIAVLEASKLHAGLSVLPPGWQCTYLVRRIGAVLEFVASRNSANELDDHLRTLTDNELLAMEGTYALTRFITWAIPILGFLGTVLGITEAISGVTPEVLEHSLNRVTDGLALAFDTTAMGLALTMITMFVSFIVERTEQGVLDAVEAYVDRELAHRFERIGAEGGEYLVALRQNSQVLLGAADQLVRQQVEVWNNAFHEAQRSRTGADQRLQQNVAGALEAALERTLETHARRLANLESQTLTRSAELVERMGSLANVARDSARESQAALAQVAQGLASQAQVLTQLQDGERQLLKLQEVLNQNLTALAGAGAFDQAVQSLTAAIHLLTARAGETQAASRLNRLDKRPGAAA